MTSEMEEEMAQAERKDIDMFLEDTAERHNLSVANVKSILRVSSSKPRDRIQNIIES